MAERRKQQPLKPSQQVAEFVERHCRVPEGKNVGHPILLRDWQRAKLERVYDTPSRRVIDSMARKNGKTAFAACLLLTHLCGPQAVPNSQIYSTAQSRDQAAIVFNLACKMVRMAPDTLNVWVRIRDTVKELVDTETGVFYKALSADHSTAYGLSPVMCFHDELGQVRGPRSELFDALETASGAHASPLSWIISTQAPSDGDLLSILIDDARSGSDPETKLFLRAAANDDPFDSLETWKKANPALGDFLSLDSLRRGAEQARRLPAFMAGFQNLNLNMRVAAQNHFISPEVWKQNGGAPDEACFRHFPVFGGLDLSAKQDLTALVLICKDQNGVVHVQPHFWTPAATIYERSRQDRVPYDQWAKAGVLETTPGVSVNYEYVAERIASLASRYQIANIAYDRWRIDELKKRLDEVGCKVPLSDFGQGFKDMAPALDNFAVLALDGKLRHGNHPVMTACAANSAVVTNPAGDRKLDKARSTGRIDGMVALAMAIRQMTMDDVPQGSVYEGRGVFAI